VCEYFDEIFIFRTILRLGNMKKRKMYIAMLMISFLSITMIWADSKDYGVGPIKNVKLGAIDKNLVNNGKKIFDTKCIVCHTLDDKRIGPPLRNVAKEQTPEYIMNLLANTANMQKQDERIKKLIAQYKVVMTDLKLNQNDIRSVYEYLRFASENRGFK